MTVSRCSFHNIVHTALYVDAGSAFGSGPQITANSFNQCPTGIRFYGGTLPQSHGTISGNVFENGATAIYVSRVGTSLTLRHNQFIGMTSYGVRNDDSGGTVDARYNWWGEADGPGGQGTGSGSPVSQYVNFANYWTQQNENTQGVFNVVAQRRGDTKVVDIYYDIEGDPGTTYTVNVLVSSSGGEPYTLNPASSSLSGAVGSGQPVGTSHHIEWDATVDDTGQYTDKMRVKVTADRE